MMIWIKLILLIGLCLTSLTAQGDKLNARELLKTIAPKARPPHLPPGFTALDTISTDKFRYKITKKNIIVTANLDYEESVQLFPGQITVSDIKLKFIHDKESEKKDWEALVTGIWRFGERKLNLEINSNGTFKNNVNDLTFKEIADHFYKDNPDDIGIESENIKIRNCSISGEIDRSGDTFEVSFIGDFSLPDSDENEATRIKIIVSKITEKPLKLYAVMDFKDEIPESVLETILDDKSQSVPFFKHLMTSSSLFTKEKSIFGLTISFTEVYFYEDQSAASQTLDAVLQSNIPVGVTILFPADDKKQTRKHNNHGSPRNSVNLAFVMKRPVFDLLIDEKSHMSVNDVLPIISKEFTAGNRRDILPKYMSNLHDAYTSHISFDSSLGQFYVFVRLKVMIELIPNLIRIKVTNLVLHKNIKEIGTNSSSWKMSAKGSYDIGDAKFDVQYTELEDENEENAESAESRFGLTGHAQELTLSDIIEEYNPYFYPTDESRTMIDNTEIESLKLHDVKLFSRIQAKNGTPHVLISGYTNIPQWEKNIQIALLLLRQKNHWGIKWAMSFKHSPLTNIIEALTGFVTDEIPFLHNSHIMTTLISSPLESMSVLPPHIITTPLLRLPVKKGLSVISLIKFPDECGDDRMCEAAIQLLDPKRVYTTKGTLSTTGFKLNAAVNNDLDFSDQLKGVNNSIRFTIGNASRMDVMTTVKLPQTGITFQGPIHIYENGEVKMQLTSDTKRWLNPFNMRSISIKNLKFVSTYDKNKSNLKKLSLEGTVYLGLQGNGAEIEAPVSLSYNTINPKMSSFYANFTDITLRKLLKAFTIAVKLPEVLETSTFPSGLMMTYSGKHKLTSDFQLHGDLNIFGRSLYCAISLNHPGRIKIVTENSPAPIIYARGLIIVQESHNSKLKGPKIISKISHKDASVSMKGYVKLLGLESDVDIELTDEGISFEVEGKLMEYKNTKLKASSKDTPDKFQVSGCLPDVTLEVQLLLIETITKSANQSVVNMQKAEENFLNARKFYTLADAEEIQRRDNKYQAKSIYEDALVDFGRYDIIAKDTCNKEQCSLKCFGCPKLNRCCRMDIFGHCIACASWKSCCWKNIDPLCIAKQDGCHVIKSQAEKELAAKEAHIVQQRILLDNMEQLLTTAEIEKGKHKAVLEAAIDAKQIVEEDSAPGLNAHDSIRIFGPAIEWAKVNSVCYNASITQAATGCMEFIINVELFNRGPKDVKIWSCLKEDLITELTESLANYIFPKMIDTTADSVQELSSKLNLAEAVHPSNISKIVPSIVPSSQQVNKPITDNPMLPSLITPNIIPPSLQVKKPMTITQNLPSATALGTNYNEQPINGPPSLPSLLTPGSMSSNDGQTPYNIFPSNGTMTSILTSKNEPPVKTRPVQTSSPALNVSITATPVDNMEYEPLNKHPSQAQPLGQTKPVSTGGKDRPVALSIQPEDSDEENENIDEDDNEKAPIYSGSGYEVSGQKEIYINASGDEIKEDEVEGAEDDEDSSGEKPVMEKGSLSPTKNVEKTDKKTKEFDTTKKTGESEEDKEGDGNEDVSSAEESETLEEEDETPTDKKITNKDNKPIFKVNQKTNTSKLLAAITKKIANKGKKQNNRMQPQIKEDFSPENANTENEQSQNQKNSNNDKQPKYPYDPSNSYPYIHPVPFQQTSNKNNNSQITNAGNIKTLESQQNRKTFLTNNNRLLNKPKDNFKNGSPVGIKSYQTQNKMNRKGIFTSKNLQNVNLSSFKFNSNSATKSSNKGKIRERRSIIDEIASRTSSLEDNKNILLTNPFWDIHTDHNTLQVRSEITKPKGYHKTLNTMINKRWLIPDNSGGKCHVFHQLLAICKDMAETIVILDKSLKESQLKFLEEDKNVYLELFKTEEDLVTATKRVNISSTVALEAAKTLGVVRQGVNIWSKRCSNEFEWQKENGVYAWLQAMDLRIQELGGYGVFRFLDNLFNAFEALFDRSGLVDSDEERIIESTRKISKVFHKVFKQKLDVGQSREHANTVLDELMEIKRTKVEFCQ